MPIGGKLKLKGGLTVTSSGVEKAKKKKKKHKEVAAEGEQPEGQEADKPIGISVMSNKSYEEEFALEMNKVQKKAGSAAKNKILHGYDKKVTGKTAGERLDMRSSMKSDKFCK